jgi:predicted site-specific integrase-resolvase
MKANKVLEKLEISRKSLSNYVSQGKIRVTSLDNGFYDYNDSDVELLEKSMVTHENKVVIYFNGNKYQYNLSSDKIETIKRIAEVI